MLLNKAGPGGNNSLRPFPVPPPPPETPEGSSDQPSKLWGFSPTSAPTLSSKIVSALNKISYLCEQYSGHVIRRILSPRRHLVQQLTRAYSCFRSGHSLNYRASFLELFS